MKAIHAGLEQLEGESNFHFGSTILKKSNRDRLYKGCPEKKDMQIKNV